MKAITLHQPWATLIAIGAKQFETRGWKLNYRGPIAIHAANKIIKDGTFSQSRDWLFEDVLQQHNYTLFDDDTHRFRQLPRGVILAVATITDCVRTENIAGNLSPQELETSPLEDGHGNWKISPCFTCRFQQKESREYGNGTMLRMRIYLGRSGKLRNQQQTDGRRPRWPHSPRSRFSATTSLAGKRVCLDIPPASTTSASPTKTCARLQP